MIQSCSYILLLLLWGFNGTFSNHVYRRGNGETLRVRVQTNFQDPDGTLKAADVDPCRSLAILTKPQGTLDYPAAGSYKSFRYCRWIIYARNPQSKINIKFTFISLEQDDPCDDYVQIFTMTHKPDASGQHKATDFSGRLCPSQIGQMPRKDYEIDSPAVLIVFRSDWIFNARGFTLNYEIKPPKQPATTRPTMPSITTPTTTSNTIRTTPTTTESTSTSTTQSTTMKRTTPTTKQPTTLASTTSAEPFDASRFLCNFEDSGCAWINKPNVDLRFVIKKAKDSVWTNWGKEDHTTGTSAGSYVYLYTNRAKQGNLGTLVSPELSPNPNSPRCLTFWYNMLQTTSSLVVTVTDEVGHSKEVFRRDGGQGKNWHPGKVTLQNDKPYFVEISHTRGVYDVESGVIIDDISILRNPCPSVPQECGRSSFAPISKTNWEPVPMPFGSDDTSDISSDQTFMKIIGGMDSGRHEWPWIVRIRVFKTGIKEGTFSQCGGTLIDPQWVITAAHCFETGTERVTDPSHTLISFGEHHLTESAEPEFTLRPAKVFFHSNRAETLKQRGVLSKLYDIALLQLKSPVTLDARVNTACLPKAPFAPGAACFALGWGLDDTDKVSSVLQELKKTVLSRDDCSYRIIDGMICAIGHSHSDVCAGDSGGPLVCQRAGKYELAGIVSFGDKCSAKRRTSGVYADVLHFRAWIQETMNSV